MPKFLISSPESHYLPLYVSYLNPMRSRCLCRVSQSQADFVSCDYLVFDLVLFISLPCVWIALDIPVCRSIDPVMFDFDIWIMLWICLLINAACFYNLIQSGSVTLANNHHFWINVLCIFSDLQPSPKLINKLSELLILKLLTWAVKLFYWGKVSTECVNWVGLRYMVLFM